MNLIQIIDFILQPISEHRDIHVDSWVSVQAAVPVHVEQSNQFFVDDQRSPSIRVARAVPWCCQVTSAEVSVGDIQVVSLEDLTTDVVVDQWNCYHF